MNPKIFFITIIISINILPAFCQFADPCSCDTTNSDQRLTGEVFYNSSNDIGSQFFKSEWLPGDIYLTNGSNIYNQYHDYNGFIDELIYLESSTLKQVVLDKELILGFTIIDKKANVTYNFTRLNIKKDVMDSSFIFAQILYRSRMELFVYRRIIKLELKQYDRNKYSKNEFNPSPIYFFKFPDGKFFDFKNLHRKDLYAWFPQKALIIRKTLKENKLRRFKSEGDLIKVSEILNSILY